MLELTLETRCKFKFECLVIVAPPLPPGFLPAFEPNIRDRGNHFDGAPAGCRRSKSGSLADGNGDKERTEGCVRIRSDSLPHWRRDPALGGSKVGAGNAQIGSGLLHTRRRDKDGPSKEEY